jgi:hypothetical protein
MTAMTTAGPASLAPALLYSAGKEHQPKSANVSRGEEAMSHRHHHHCPACHRPRHGLTADEVFEVMTRRLSQAKIAMRVRHLRRLAQRIGCCDCNIRIFAPPPLAESLVVALVGERLVREAA